MHDLKGAQWKWFLIRILYKLQAEGSVDKVLKLNSENQTVFNGCSSVTFEDPGAFSTGTLGG